MTDIQKAQLLRAYTPINKVERTAANHSWALPKGTMIFPEGRCPFCRAPIRSKGIWVADRRVVNAHYTISRAGKLRRSAAIEHPHAHGSGGICMGNQRAGSEGAALFLGLTPSDSYWGSNSTQWRIWLAREFGHDCPEAPTGY